MFFAKGLFATDFFFDAVLTAVDFGAPPTPIIESVGDLDEGAVGDGFFIFLVEGDTLFEEVEKMLRVGERLGVWGFVLANGLTEGDLLLADVLNKFRVGERLGEDVTFG